MQAYASGTGTINSTGTEIDLTASAPGGIAMCILRWRVISGGNRIMFSPPGLAVDATKCAESASSSGETATSGAMRIAGGNPTLVCASAQTAVVAWTLYALTDEGA